MLTLCLLGTSMGCAQHGKLEVVADFPKSLNEVSGMWAAGEAAVWVIEDSSNPDRLFEVDTSGQLLRSFKVKGGGNKDWEALAADSLGNVYIGDFGNNGNSRKNLRIYKVPDPRIEPGDKIDAERLDFNYPEQEEFPPTSDSMRFDAEALFHYQGMLYIIGKNRSDPFDGTADVWRIPDSTGTYEASHITQLQLCRDFETCQITGATLSPSGERLVLLSYGKLFVYEDFGKRSFSQTPRVIDLETRSQLESISFVTNTLLYLADERSHGRGGNLYRFELPYPAFKK
ncbi:hypothetical protein SAMN04490243_1440 [Robiginitalea myxolifaciens]|uniref:SdiA-regulated n=2 Tax=Robiginitalea myxolifaciens TaxID=400055 RepID=A0A1I6G9F6_9FLAO|nr:hypothetical protein SAMN04490243_1440 [Robiginitalea myxolifaciens]